MSVTVLSQAPGERSLTSSPPDAAVKIDLDERCFVFPDGKPITHVLLVTGPGRTIAFDAVFAFNHTRRSSRILELSLHEAKGFVRELLNAVYYAKTAFAISESVRITINVAANGYHVEFLRFEQPMELFLGTGAIWRFIKGVLFAIDASTPVVSN